LGSRYFVSFPTGFDDERSSSKNGLQKYSYFRFPARGQKKYCCFHEIHIFAIRYIMKTS
jgi:hypothetical protein